MARFIPSATYRLQFHSGFTFVQATAILDYLNELGISHIYSSPYFQASAGSTHGYDVADHNRLSPSVGTWQDYDRFIAALHGHEMGHLLDFVPNHMGISEPVNRWWMDVLENGQWSLYADYFDIEWHPIKEELENKVLLPILGDRYGNVLERGEFKIGSQNGCLFLRYGDARVPLNPRSYPFILDRVASELQALIPADAHDELQRISMAFAQLPCGGKISPEKLKWRAREKEVGKRRLARLLNASHVASKKLEEVLRKLEGKIGSPESFDDLHSLLCAQSYRLAYWRVAAEEINYRRFFDITSLAAIKVEIPEVFEASHQLVLQMLARGEVTGLRIDHIDGLWDPKTYLERLHSAGAAGSIYLLVEKILGRNEFLPAEWPVKGTTGYEFASDLVLLLVDENAESDFSRIYSAFAGGVDFEDLVYEKKILVSRMALASEIAELAHLLDQLSEKNRLYRDFTLNQLTAAIRETIACFPVYRTYVTPDRVVRDEDRVVIRFALRRARRRNPSIDREVFDYLGKLLTFEPTHTENSAMEVEHTRFVMKFQQTSGPIMAKGLEDTAFYIYNRLVALNDVGGEPGHFGIGIESFHNRCEERQKRTPHTLLATSTHDTKRSEDVRARIAGLSECAAEWDQHLQLWKELNARWKTECDNRLAPSPNEEYLFYQNLLGAWPLEELNEVTRPEWIRRLQEYMLKALKEAKINTSWVEPDEQWESATSQFVCSVLDPKRNAPFLENFLPFAKRLAQVGAVNSLTQTVLKMTTPGVPDFYQGCEIWDWSLVDPDNRRPVDYKLRRHLLASIAEAKPSKLLTEWTTGGVKLFVIQKLLHFRRNNPSVFEEGTYHPLDVRGTQADKVVGFLRKNDALTIAVLVPRLTANLPFPPVGRVWQDTRCTLPAGDWEDLFSCSQHQGGDDVKLADLWVDFPWTCLVSRAT